MPRRRSGWPRPTSAGAASPRCLPLVANLQSAVPALIASSPEALALVVGGAGSIGSAVVRELFRRQPRVLHVVDVSENNLAELVRDISSSMGYIEGDFRAFALDCGSSEFDAMLEAIRGLPIDDRDKATILRGSDLFSTDRA